MPSPFWRPAQACRLDGNPQLNRGLGNLALWSVSEVNLFRCKWLQILTPYTMYAGAPLTGDASKHDLR